MNADKKENREMKSIDRNLKTKGASTPYLVKVAYPREARAKDQVEIVEVVSAGWSYDETSKKK